MIISKVNTFSLATTQVDRKIVLKPFVDLYFDTAGWYAFGHHAPEAFLKAVIKQEPFAQFSIAQVQLGWANFDGNDFEIAEIPNCESQAITLIQKWD